MKGAKGKYRSKDKEKSKQTMSSSEDETNVVQKKSRHGVAAADVSKFQSQSSADITDDNKRRMDVDLEERDAFVARLLEKEESKSRKAEKVCARSGLSSSLITIGLFYNTFFYHCAFRR